MKVIDFGFSTFVGENEKGTVFCGTPAYMSPEIVEKRNHCYFKADIWALGVVLYTLMSGKFPFKGESNKDLFNKIKRAQYSLPEGISIEAKALLLKLLQIDPEKRISSDQTLEDNWLSELKNSSQDFHKVTSAYLD